METQKLAVFDFDGTLSRGLTICETLASDLSKLPRMQELEKSRTKEQITAARLEMASWYRAVTREDLEKSLEKVKLAPGVMEGFSLLRSHGVKIAIASITWLFCIQYFAKLLSVDSFIGSEITKMDDIEHVWPEHKKEFVELLAMERKIPLARVAAIGDSEGDREMLEAVGIPIFVGRTLPEKSDGWLHMPEANIADIAIHLVEVWQ